MKSANQKTKVITICGSLKFKEEMMKVAMQMELAGNVILIPIFPTNDNYVCTLEESLILGQMHKEKIKMSDAIYVVNVNGYIGESTRSEIDYARSLNKEILSLNPLILN